MSRIAIADLTAGLGVVAILVALAGAPTFPVAVGLLAAALLLTWGRS